MQGTRYNQERESQDNGMVGTNEGLFQANRMG